ncbi:hypothetical protein TNCV_150751 [Trichonephila clavipes]|nr:hypothetical protein TNCV_150751 [Trichonephila clavipes]
MHHPYGLVSRMSKSNPTDPGDSIFLRDPMATRSLFIAGGVFNILPTSRRIRLLGIHDLCRTLDSLSKDWNPYASQVERGS